MAANPAAAGASGLSAATSGTVTGGPTDPLDDVRAMFTTLVMNITQRDGMINAHNLTSMDNFYYIRVDDSKSLVNIWNETSLAVDTKVGIPT